jgi:hypothetical protein
VAFFLQVLPVNGLAKKIKGGFMQKLGLFLGLIGLVLAAEFSAEAVTTIESPLLGKKVVTQNIKEWPRPDKIYQDKLFAQFDFQISANAAGRQMLGRPKETDSSFSRLFIQLDQKENLTDLKLYDRKERELLSLKNTYTETQGVFLPACTEVFLSESNLKTMTEYRNIRFAEGDQI